jgi:hypothetical protein
MVETAVSVFVIWFVIALIGFLLFAAADEISYRFTKTGKFVFYGVSAAMMLPLLVIVFILWVLWLLAYPLHLMFVKKEYRKNFIEYALIKERLM